MKLKLHNIYILIVVSFFLTILSARAQKYNFRNYSVGNGLAQSQVRCIYEDSRGNVWFGTLGGGLSRYDGYEFTTYTEDDGLISNYILALYEDGSGKLWIGTEDGLAMYDGSTFFPIEGEKHLNTALVKTIIQDKEGILWFGTQNNGLFSYNGQNFSVYPTKNGLPGKTINCLYEDEKGVLWIGTELGLCKYNGKSFSVYTARDGLAMNNVRGITSDQKGNLWIATYGGGINCFSGDRFYTFSVNSGLCNNTVFDVLCDHNGNIWCGTAIGVSRFDGDKFVTYSEKEGLCSNVVSCLMEDSSGNIWIGSLGGGVSKYDNERFIHITENEKMGRWVYSVATDTNGNLWFGTSQGGVTRFDGKDFVLEKGNQGLTASKVKTIFRDRDGNMWLGTLGSGAYIYENNHYKKFREGDGLAGNSVSCFTQDTSGNIWYGTLNRGIGSINKDQEIFIKLRKPDGIVDDHIYSICVDSSNAIWIGTSGAGVSRIVATGNESEPYQIVNYSRKDGLSGETVNSIVCDIYGNVFFGTAGNGISIFDGKKFINITRKQGISSNTIYSLIFDKDNNLWVGTEKGIDRISFGKELSISFLHHYNANEGFTGIESFRNAVCLDEKGCIWFGTVMGATRYDPELDIPNKLPPKTHITGIRLFFDRIEDTPYGEGASPWYPLPAGLELPYDMNHLIFEFTGINLRNPEAVKYQWKLDGFDDDWSPVLSQREATYSNIPAGNYTFMVKACNENNVWNEAPVTFSFKINKPFWQEWWFRIVAVFGFLLIIWLIFSLRLREIRKINEVERKQLEMEKHMIELEQEAARLQMNPHFIFNALNSIQGFIANNDPFQAKRYLAKFARLMRLTLENAREEFIPLENEIELLRNYLELEQLTSKNKFDFTIDMDESIDLDQSEIPPMMIQPFVENAILHGIKPKEGRGEISVWFRREKEFIKCEITDNGVGRKVSEELKRQAAKVHKSTGMSVTKERLEQLSLQGGIETGVEIIDLFDAENKASGTKIIITIPFDSF